MKQASFYKSQQGKTVFFAMGSDVNTNEKSGDMELLNPNTVDAAKEKHVPVVSAEDGKLVIRVGSQPHPMTEEHYIDWIFVKTSYGGIYCDLEIGDEPVAMLPFAPEEVISVYAYCNLHGLWKAKEPVLPVSFSQNTVACSAEFTAGCVNPQAE